MLVISLWSCCQISICWNTDGRILTFEFPVALLRASRACSGLFSNFDVLERILYINWVTYVNGWYFFTFSRWWHNRTSNWDRSRLEIVSFWVYRKTLRLILFQSQPFTQNTTQTQAHIKYSLRHMNLKYSCGKIQENSNTLRTQSVVPIITKLLYAIILYFYTTLGRCFMKQSGVGKISLNGNL